MMRAIQILAHYAYGNAIANVMRLLTTFLENHGYEVIVLTMYFDSRLDDERVRKVARFSDFEYAESDILFYHFYDGMSANEDILYIQCKKVLVFQNVTPAEFFRPFDHQTFLRLTWGEHDVKRTVGKYQYALCMSEFSKNDLIKAGWNSERILVTPLVPLKEKGLPDEKIKNKIEKNDFFNILFVGRISENKKIEDIILSFAEYKSICKESRLFLVGSTSHRTYYTSLLNLIEENNIKDIFFTDAVTEEALEAYYSIADVYLCLSEHEGLCLPILEAMDREIPVIAYASTAVTETVGAGGVLLRNKDAVEICKILEKIRTDIVFRESLKKAGKQWVSTFSMQNNEETLTKMLMSIKKEQVNFKMNMNSLCVVRPSTLKVQIEKIFDVKGNYNSKVIIYGCGKIGKSLFNHIKQIGFENNIVCFCDNTISGEYGGKEILKHEVCMTKFLDAKFLISVQKDYKNIMRALFISGVEPDMVFIYEEKTGQIR